MNSLQQAFSANFEEGLELGAALSVWVHGREVLSLHRGVADSRTNALWSAETLVLVWSATKGPAAACLLHAMDSAGLELETPVGTVWPEISSKGPRPVTFAEVLSHRSGLIGLDHGAPALLDHASVVRALELQEFVPRSDPAYSPRLYGFFLDELLRRVAGGESLGEYWRRVFADPLGLDFWIGLPASFHARVATMTGPRAGPPREDDLEFAAAFSDPSSLTRRAFSTPPGISGPSQMNSPAHRSASLPAMGGIGSASALAGFYAMLANGGCANGVTFFTPPMIEAMRTPLVRGYDAVLKRPVAFAAGFMLDFAPEFPCAFGHPGAGGSLAFADPRSGVAFAYVMNRMDAGAMPGPRCQRLVKALAECLPPLAGEA